MDMNHKTPSTQAMAAARDIAGAFAMTNPPREMIASMIDHQTRFPELSAVSEAVARYLTAFASSDGKTNVEAVDLSLQNLAKSMIALLDSGVDFHTTTAMAIKIIASNPSP